MTNNKNIMAYYLLAGILVFTVLVYTGVFNNGPYADDFSWMRNCFREHECHSIPGMMADSFNFTGSHHFYRPLAEIFFVTLSSIFGKSTFYYHAVSVLLHLLNGILVFYLLNMLFKHHKTALMGAFLFLVHPGTNETVYWISGIISLFFTLFYLLALTRFIRCSVNNKVTTSDIILISLYGALALLTKESAITLLPMLWISMYFTGTKKLHGLKVVLLVILCISVLYAFVQYPVENRNYLIKEKIYEPGMHFFKNILVFHFVLLFPKEVNSTYGKQLLYLVPTFLASLLAFIMGNKQTRYLVIWCWVTLLPASFFHYKAYITSRYLYLPSIGFCGILSYFFFRVVSHIKKSKILLALFLAPVCFYIFFYCYKSYFNDLYFEAKAQRYKNMYLTIKKYYPEIPKNGRIFLFGFPTLDVHVNAMMKVWEDPSLEAYTNLYLDKLVPGSIILSTQNNRIFDFTNVLYREKREIIFGEPYTILFLKAGWTNSVYDQLEDVRFNWINGKRAVCQAPIWEPSWYQLRMKIRYSPKLEGQQGVLEITLNSHQVETITLTSGWEEYRVEVPSSATRHGYDELVFSMPKKIKLDKPVLANAAPIKHHPGNIGIAYLQFIPVEPPEKEVVSGKKKVLFPED